MRLNYYLDKQSHVPLYWQLYEQIKQAICAKEFALGEKLPSKRRLCEHLQISQNTLESAYEQLLAEGYIESRPRSGFFVSFQAEQNRQPVSLPTMLPKPQTQSKANFDMNPNQIDCAYFPLKIWKKCGAKGKNFADGSLLRLGEQQGDWALREQITAYLAASRGVSCQPEQIIIRSGIEDCMQQLMLLFNQQFGKDFRYAMERYGYAKIEQLLALHGKSMQILPMDLARGELDFDALEKLNIQAALITPSNIYPFGQVLSIQQRYKLLEWANARSDRFLIEDDYDSEFRYKGKPIPALQSLDGQKVIYLGSFSKLLMPSLRIGFMVLPPSLLSAYQTHCGFFHSPVSRFEQQRLANFIQQGELDRHINRMRKIYRRKMELLCQLLAPHKDCIRYYGENSGFYLLIEVIKISQKSTALLTLAEKAGVKLYPIKMDDRPFFVLGFGALSESELEQAVERLLHAWGINER